jgi:hypothetical protein
MILDVLCPKRKVGNTYQAHRACPISSKYYAAAGFLFYNASRAISKAAFV